MANGSTSSSSESGQEYNLRTGGDVPNEGQEDSSSSTSVSASDFAAYSAMVEVRLDALVASSVVLVVALLFSCGIMAVQTILRSLERW